MEWIKVFSSREEARDRLRVNTTQLLIIRGERICLAKYGEEFLAVQDACSHNGESLSKGKVNFAGEIICPWHNYRFDLKSGKACDSGCRDLKTYPLKYDDAGFFIGI